MPPIALLVRPQMGENIGATARAMMNFGWEELRIVAPRDGWPNEAALAMSAHAEHIIHNARVYDTLPEALEGVQHVFACTARPRTLQLPVLTPEQAAEKTQDLTGHRVAYMFGAERSGLENDEIARAHAIINIPTHPDNASLNLAQSVVITAYSWWNQAGERPAHLASALPDTASGAELEYFYNRLSGMLEHTDFFMQKERKNRILQQLHTTLRRSQFTSQDIRLWHGVLGALAGEDFPPPAT